MGLVYLHWLPTIFPDFKLTILGTGEAILVEEKDLDKKLFEELGLLMKDEGKQKRLASNCKEMDTPKAVERIVDFIEELINA